MIIQLLENFALWLDDLAQVCSYFSIMIIVPCLIIYYVVVNALGEQLVVGSGWSEDFGGSNLGW